MFSLPLRIYWEDTDAGGVVYHARYLGFLERARSEWMRGLGYGQDASRRELNCVFAVRSMQLEFLAPARLDDALEVTVRLKECRRASATFVQQVRRGGDVLLTAVVRVAALDAAAFRPAPVPSQLYEAMKAQVVPDA